ncbi:MAG: hypothetical protein ACXWM1_14750, partial [Candidatus Binataceae bacterium]
PFSRATKAAGLVFVSGASAPHDPARGIHRGDTAAEQVRNSLQRIAEIIRERRTGARDPFNLGVKLGQLRR